MAATRFGSVDSAIAGLEDFRSRAEAIASLLKAGSAARDKVRKLLDSRNTSLVWCAIRLLGQLGEESDIVKIQDFAREPEYASVALDSLAALGAEVPSHVQSGGLGCMSSVQMGDEQLVRAAIAGTVGTHVSRKKDSEDYVVTVSVGSERRDVTVTFPQDEDGMQLVTVWTDVGAKAEPEFYERVLKLNARLPDGAVGIQTINGEAKFVMTDTHLRETLDPPELGKSIFGLARFGARIAQRIAQFKAGG